MYSRRWHASFVMSTLLCRKSQNLLEAMKAHLAQAEPIPEGCQPGKYESKEVIILLLLIFLCVLTRASKPLSNADSPHVNFSACFKTCVLSMRDTNTRLSVLELYGSTKTLIHQRLCFSAGKYLDSSALVLQRRKVPPKYQEALTFATRIQAAKTDQS